MRKLIPAIVSDIDGVLIRGVKQIQNADISLFHILKQQIPFCLLTNGGGETEQTRIDHLNEIIFEKQKILKPENLILSHTPFKNLSHYYDKYVLVGGQGDLVKVAQNYGYKKAIHVREMDLLFPYLNPKRTSHNPSIKEALLNRFQMTEAELISDIEIKAVMIWSDVDLFEVHLQVISDILISEDGRIRNQNIQIGNEQKIKMYYSNEDLTYPNQINIPRHAGGVFKIALESVFYKQYQREIVSQKYGKPNILQYKYAEQCIQQQIQDRIISTIYMIGDNIHSDIQGVNNLMESKLNNFNWKSILVKTGCYQTGQTNNANYVVNSIQEAVQLVCNLENIQNIY